MFSLKHKSNKIIAFICNKDDDDDMKAIYIHPRTVIDTNNLPDGYFMEYKVTDPNYELRLFPEHVSGQTDRIFICGPTGAGKSSWIKSYISYFNELNPKSKHSLLFTKLDEDNFDESLKEVQNKIAMVTLDKTFIEEPINVRDLSDRVITEDGKRLYNNRVVIFDDYQQNSVKVDNEVNRLRNDIGDNGRKLGLYLLVCQSNIPLQTIPFRQFLSNCSAFVYFPLRRPSNLISCLKNYFNIDTPERVYLESKTTSRWVLVTKHDIPFILTSDYCCINDQVYILEKAAEDKALKKKYVKKSQPVTPDSIIKPTNGRLSVFFDSNCDTEAIIDGTGTKLKLCSIVSDESTPKAGTKAATKTGTKGISTKDITFLNSLPQKTLNEAIMMASTSLDKSLNPFEGPEPEPESTKDEPEPEPEPEPELKLKPEKKNKYARKPKTKPIYDSDTSISDTDL
jgi:hypothetical protein